MRRTELTQAGRKGLPSSATDRVAASGSRLGTPRDADGAATHDDPRRTTRSGSAPLAIAAPLRLARARHSREKAAPSPKLALLREEGTRPPQLESGQGTAWGPQASPTRAPDHETAGGRPLASRDRCDARDYGRASPPDRVVRPAPFEESCSAPQARYATAQGFRLKPLASLARCARRSRSP